MDWVQRKVKAGDVSKRSIKKSHKQTAKKQRSIFEINKEILKLGPKGVASNKQMGKCEQMDVD